MITAKRTCLTLSLQIAKTIFNNKVTVQQLRDLNNRLLRKYKIYEEVMETTGTGRPDDEVVVSIEYRSSLGRTLEH